MSESVSTAATAAATTLMSVRFRPPLLVCAVLFVVIVVVVAPAAGRGCLCCQMVQLLVEHKANVNALDRLNISPLAEAVRCVLVFLSRRIRVH